MAAREPSSVSRMTVCDGIFPVVFAGKMGTSDEILDVPLPILQEFGSCRTPAVGPLSCSSLVVALYPEERIFGRK